MFEFLKSKKNHFLGIDFGTSAIKIVEISYKNQQVFLENYGAIDLSWAGYGEKNGEEMIKASSYEKKINDLLKKLIERMKLSKGSLSYVSIPGFSGLITIIELPEMSSEELTKAIQFEAHKYIPGSLDDVAMSWEVIHRADTGKKLIKTGNANEDKSMRILLVAAPKREIERYDRFVSDTSLKVGAIELETFSIARALVGEDPGVFLLIDMGYRATNIILYEKGIVIANRNIDAGGNEITLAISESMGISKQRAESLKKSEKDLINSRESGIAVPVLEFVAGEAKRIIETYKMKNTGARIDGVILSGGVSKMRGIEQYFTNVLGIRAVMGNPWRRVGVEDEASILVKELGASFTVSLGLALRGVEEYKRE